MAEKNTHIERMVIIKSAPLMAVTERSSAVMSAVFRNGQLSHTAIRAAQ